MKKSWLTVLSSFFLGAGIFPMATATGKWGHIAALKEGILIVTAIACFAVALGIWYKYKLGIGRPNPALIKNPDFRELFMRFPFLLWVAPLFTQLLSFAIGFVVSVVVFQETVNALG